ncbi:hypothetical protein SO802_010630 [Lithocarpus litseifolius]|uniref:peroxidase n=1 Tax=Lithocarpus litseifolius TaxID=425828 RepID=A0AAW2DHQ5_9ROSI
MFGLGLGYLVFSSGKPKWLMNIVYGGRHNKGCDASVPLDDSNGYKNHSIPNHTLRGVDKVDFIEELEKAWLGATFMLVALSISLTGRRESIHSYFRALADIPQPDDKNDNLFVTVVTSIQYRALSDKAVDAFYKLSNTRAQIQSYVFDDAHNIQKIGCKFTQKRLSDFKGTGWPDPTIAPNFLAEMRMRSKTALLSSISSGLGFDTHYYQSFLRGRGLVFADQQLMANEKTVRLVRVYASDDFEWTLIRQ